MPERGKVWSKSEVIVVVANPIEVFRGLFGAPTNISPPTVVSLVPDSSICRVPIKFYCMGGLYMIP